MCMFSVGIVYQNGPMFWQIVAKLGLNNGVKIFFVCGY